MNYLYKAIYEKKELAEFNFFAKDDADAIKFCSDNKIEINQLIKVGQEVEVKK